MHHHGYAWVGAKKAFDREFIRRPPGEAPTPSSEQEVFARYREAVAEFPASGVPPIQTAHWLMKPPSLIRGTWHEPTKAGEWLALQLTDLAPRFDSVEDREASRLVLLVESAIKRLAWGGDVSLGHYVSGNAFHSVALVTCCPNKSAPELGCPASPQSMPSMPHGDARRTRQR
ncbi:hypothetical protein [Streptomyces sp. NPDC005805]|uniref:hypothetical protein n=1 Tax=Streptomyces sp. NPDC005805 TaxID=3157068 RepID=UPI0033D114B2